MEPSVFTNVSQPALLILMGCGLILVANFVRRFPASKDHSLPKNYHVIVAVAPPELEKYLFEGNE